MHERTSSASFSLFSSVKWIEKRDALLIETVRIVTQAERTMTFLEWCELLSYIVTIIGLPFAIVVFLVEQRKERQNEEEEIFQRLSDEYREFLKLVLDNADLHLLRQEVQPGEMKEEQKERRLAIFGILISLFERAYLLVYEDDMDKQARRLWQSWEDYMREWVRRTEFREALPQLLEGEDEDFTKYIRELARQEKAKAPAAAPGGGVVGR